MGDGTNSIPAGTHGVPSGYQANIDTSQTNADMAGSPDGAMGYGSTVTLRNGASFVSNAAAVNILNVPAFGFGYDVGINKQVNGQTQFGFYAGSWGSFAATYAFYLDGYWSNGMELNGHNFTGVTNINFSTPAPGVSHGTATAYSIDGSNTDALRIKGGGTLGGMILYGSSTTGSGLVRFRSNPAAGTSVASVDTSTGNIAANAMILKSPNGNCWKVSVSNAGALNTPVSATCPAN